MICPKCQGLMVVHYIRGDFYSSDIEVDRCINCGEILDPQIVKNRLRDLAFELDTGEGEFFNATSH